MKRNIIASVILGCLLSACSSGPIKPNITGAANEVLVVINDSVAKGVAGDSLFAVLNEDLPCMTQFEPWFNISKTPHAGFTDILHPVRNIIIVNIGDAWSKVKLKHEQDKWAKPQSVMYINAPDQKSAAEAIGRYKDDIRMYFVRAERNRSIAYQRRYRDTPAVEKVKAKFGFDMVLPKGMNRFKEADNFMWISNSSRDVDQNIVIYSYPYDDKYAFTLDGILMKRDSVMMANIPGPAPDSYMATEYKVTPIFRNEKMESGEYAAEVRGIWRVEGEFMGGPFVSVSTYDKANKRIITAEAFIYAPNQYKRNLLRQLEATLYTIKFPEPEQTEE